MNLRVFPMKSNPSLTAISLLLLLVVGCGVPSEPTADHALIPNPNSLEFMGSDTFFVGVDTRITFEDGNSAAERLGRFLADIIGNTVDTEPEVVAAVEGQRDGTIHLTTNGAAADLGPEGYDLTVSGREITIRANTGAGLFYGVQTLRQLLPPVIEYEAAYVVPLPVPAVHVLDSPRFGWRGAMLDVSRHFFQVDEVKRFIDLMALYKLNRLHLHLADDQGWRIEIPSRPDLTAIGGSTQVGGKGSGFYSLAEFLEIVEYAEYRFITVVPEIDTPGHTNAALASYPELNCDGEARDLYIGTEVGFSVFCVEKEYVYEFLEDVVRDIAAISPGPYFHVGGDEVHLLPDPEFNAFIERMEGIVESSGKRLVGWEEVAKAEIGGQSTIQLWRPLWPAEGAEPLDSARAEAAAELQAGVNRALAKGATVILSPADRLYLDMKYSSSTPIGLTWAGIADVRTSYDWVVTDIFGTIPEESIAGVEAPLWSETIATMQDIEYLAFPRLAGVAEIGWTDESRRSWADFRLRLGAQAPRWTALGVNFFRSPLVPWQGGF